MQKRFKKSDGVVEREIRGSLILVPLGGDTPRIDCLYTLNNTARCVWREALAGKTEDRIVDSIVREYDVDESTARQSSTSLAPNAACICLRTTFATILFLATTLRMRATKSMSARVWG